MTKFWQLNEDPFYDDDGVLVDEDYIDPEEWDEAFPPEEVDENYDPFATVNS